MTTLQSFLYTWDPQITSMIEFGMCDLAWDRVSPSGAEIAQWPRSLSDAKLETLEVETFDAWSPLTTIKLRFSNGAESDAISSWHRHSLLMKERTRRVQIDISKTVSKVSVLKYGAHFFGIQLSDAHGSTFVNESWGDGNGKWVSELVPDGLRILGVKCHVGTTVFISRVGFLLGRLKAKAKAQGSGSSLSLQRAVHREETI